MCSCNVSSIVIVFFWGVKFIKSICYCFIGVIKVSFCYIEFFGGFIDLFNEGVRIVL